MCSSDLHGAGQLLVSSSTRKVGANAILQDALPKEIWEELVDANVATLTHACKTEALLGFTSTHRH